MEKLNNTRIYEVGERFTIIDLNSLKIPKTTESEKPVVVQLKPRVLPAFVTRVDPDHDEVEDQLWHRVFLQAKTTLYKRGSTFEMHTKRRIQIGVYSNRSWSYLFVDRTDPAILREFLCGMGDLDPRLANTNLSRLFAEQLVKA